MAKYIRCDYCGKRINFGEFAYHFEYDTVYCSETCYCASTAQGGIVNEDFANSCDSLIYDDEARKEEIQKEMEKHRMAMEKLFKELETLTTQN
jgi:hypothetical protein